MSRELRRLFGAVTGSALVQRAHPVITHSFSIISLNKTLPFFSHENLFKFYLKSKFEYICSRCTHWARIGDAYPLKSLCVDKKPAQRFNMHVLIHCSFSLYLCWSFSTVMPNQYIFSLLPEINERVLNKEMRQKKSKVFLNKSEWTCEQLWSLWQINLVTTGGSVCRRDVLNYGVPYVLSPLQSVLTCCTPEYSERNTADGGFFSQIMPSAEQSNKDVYLHYWR